MGDAVSRRVTSLRPTSSRLLATRISAARLGVMGVPEPDSDEQKKFHSMCRWNKSVADLDAFINEHRGVESSVDGANGNQPIHIAAQNGHINVVKALIKQKVNLDAKNKAGNTALHMSRAYDYYWCGKLLIEAGARLDGDKSSDDAVPGI